MNPIDTNYLKLTGILYYTSYNDYIHLGDHYSMESSKNEELVNSQ